MNPEQLIIQLILHLIPDDEDRPLTEEEQQMVAALYRLKDDPEGLQEILAEVTGEDVQLSLGKRFSSTYFDLADAGYKRSQGSPLDRVANLSKIIDASDLAGDGIEAEPHITVKYGLHTNNPDEIAESVKEFGVVNVCLGKISVFPAKETGDFDVVKIDVISNDIHRLNKLIANSFETTDTHPEYKPHITVAYVKPGRGKKYSGSWDGEGLECSFSRMIFSNQDRNKTVIPISRIGNNVQLSLGKQASPTLDDLLAQVAPPGIAVSTQVQQKVAALVKKNFLDGSS